MVKTKINLLILLVVTLLCSGSFLRANAESTRRERRLIMQGNDLYRQRKFVEAQSIYEQALKENGASAEAKYNLGLSQIRQIVNPADTTARNREITEKAKQNFEAVAKLAKTKPGLAAKAIYNLGNIEFNGKEFQKAIDYYKQALRIDPNDDRARKNLRIAQKNLKEQNQDQNKQNQAQQDQQDQKDKSQPKPENRDQDKKEPPKENNLSPQAASQILQAVDNKENQTRARVNRANKGEKSVGSARNPKRW